MQKLSVTFTEGLRRLPTEYLTDSGVRISLASVEIYELIKHQYASKYF